MSANANAVRELERTDWIYVGLLILAGMCAAMQLGKVPPALPALQRDLGLGLVGAAWVISMFSVIGAAAGTLAGSLADRYGHRRVAVAGLLCMAGAGALGGVAAGPAVMLLSRAIEGMAFVIAVVAIPSLLAASASSRDRRFVPALWGTYMPTGMAIALVLAPLLVVTAGWRVLWELNAVLLVVLAFAVAYARPHLDPPQRGRSAVTARALWSVITAPRARLLSLIFGCYTFQYLAVLGFLPSILQEQGVPLRAAGVLTAAAVLCNAIGNLAAGWLLARGRAAWELIALALVVMGIAALGLFAPSLSATLHFLLMVVFFGFGGLVPASIFATVPSAAPDPGATATTMGVVVQASHVGQLVGPPAVAALATAIGGWESSPWILLPVGALGLAGAAGLRTARAGARTA